FDFTASDVDSSQAPTEHSIDAMMLLMRVAQNQHEFADTDIAPSVVFAREGDPTRVDMPAGAWEVLACVDGRRSARSIAAELDLTEKHVYHLLSELERLDIIERAPYSVEDPIV